MHKIVAAMRSEQGFETRVLMYPKKLMIQYKNTVVAEYERLANLSDTESIDVNIINIDKQKYNGYHVVHCIIKVVNNEDRQSQPASQTA